MRKLKKPPSRRTYYKLIGVCNMMGVEVLQEFKFNKGEKAMDMAIQDDAFGVDCVLLVVITGGGLPDEIIEIYNSNGLGKPNRALNS